MTANEKKAEKIILQDGTPVRTVYDASGNIVYEQTANLEGVLPLSFKSKGKNCVDYKIYGQSVQDGTPTPEEPVEVESVGIKTENGYKVDVVSSGKNLATTAIYKNNCVIAANGAENAANNFCITEAIAVTAGANYAISFKRDSAGTDPIRIGVYDENDNFVTRFTSAISGVVFAMPNNAKYIRLSYGNNPALETYLYDIQFELGSTSTNYEPYRASTTTPIYIGTQPLRRIGEYADYVDFKNKRVVRWIKELVLTGEENFSRDPDTSVCVMTNLAAIKPTLTKAYAISSHYDSFPSVGVYTLLANNALCIRSLFGQLWIRDSNFITLADFKSFLVAQYEQGTPVAVYYVLAEPEIEYLDDLNKIPTFKGTTVLDVEEELKPRYLYVKYKK